MKNPIKIKTSKFEQLKIKFKQFPDEKKVIIALFAISALVFLFGSFAIILNTIATTSSEATAEEKLLLLNSNLNSEIENTRLDISEYSFPALKEIVDTINADFDNYDQEFSKISPKIQAFSIPISSSLTSEIEEEQTLEVESNQEDIYIQSVEKLVHIIDSQKNYIELRGNNLELQSGLKQATTAKMRQDLSDLSTKLNITENMLGTINYDNYGDVLSSSKNSLNEVQDKISEYNINHKDTIINELNSLYLDEYKTHLTAFFKLLHENEDVLNFDKPVSLLDSMDKVDDLVLNLENGYDEDLWEALTESYDDMIDQLIVINQKIEEELN